MPRAKATKKKVEEPLELNAATTNGDVVNENAGSADAAAAADAKVLTKGKPRAKKASKTTPAESPDADQVENSQPQPAARGGRKKQYKEEEENVGKEPKAPKGRLQKASSEPDVIVEAPEPKSSKPVKSRAKKEKQPAVVEEEEEPAPAPAPAPPKGRAKRGKATDVEESSAPKEIKARGRKRKDPSEDASDAVVEEAEPPKQRTKKEQPPLNAAEPPAQKGKENKSEPTTNKRARVNKRLADSEIAEVLDEEDAAPEPQPQPKATTTNKRTKKAKAVENGVQAEPVPIGDSKTEADAVPTKATNTRTKKAKEPEAEAAKPTKQRAKKEDKEEPAPEPATSKKRTQKASAKKENDEELGETAESKPVRGRKKPAAKSEAVVDDDALDGSKTSKAKAKKVEKPAEAKVNLDKADFALPADKVFNFKISSWNVAGLRAWLKKDGLQSLALEEPDIFCLQETKCSNDQLPEEVTNVPGYHPYWLCMPGGYAGVAIYSKIMPIHVEYGIGNEEFDDVGRMITAEYEKFYLINVYVPNSGRKLVNLEARMRWEKLFQSYVQKLDALKAVVICGDMNVSHGEIDLENPKTNTKNAGFTKEERDKMSELLGLGFVDTFRHLYPDKKGAYTFWTYMSNARARNVGWRLDYCIVSERFVPRVVDHVMRSQLLGSDHCPITVFLNI